MIEHSVEGVFTIMRTPDPSNCICCEGDHHVFAYGVELPGEPLVPGCRGMAVARVPDWLSSVLYPLREQIQGAKVRIIVKIEPIP